MPSAVATCGLPVVTCRGLRPCGGSAACPGVLWGTAANTQFFPLPIKAERPHSYRGVKSEVLWASHSYPGALPVSVDNTEQHRCRHKASGECRIFYAKTIRMTKKVFWKFSLKGSEIIGSDYSYSRTQAKIPLLLLSTEQTELILSSYGAPKATSFACEGPWMIVDVSVHYKCVHELPFNYGKEGWSQVKWSSSRVTPHGLDLLCCSSSPH